MAQKHHNLNAPQEDFLINSLTTADFGVYTDSVTGVKMLVAKKHGFSIPYIGPHGTGHPSYQKNCSDDGQIRVVGMLLDDICPCEECGANYGILIRKTPKNAGRFNTMPPLSVKPYAGKIDSPLQCVSGLIPAATMTDMMDDMINQVNGDIGVSDPNSGAGAHAGYMYRIYDAGAWNAADGVNINGTSYAGATRALFIADVNSGTDAYAFADQNSVEGVYIIANDTPTSLTIDTPLGDIVIGTDLYIGIVANDVDVPIDVFIADESDVTGTMTVVQAGYFASLTPEEVFATFANMGHHGSLANNIYQDKPIKDVHYCKYHVVVEGDIDSLNSGASQSEHYDYAFDLYIKEDQLSGKVWDASGYMWESDHAGFSADKSFDELLAYWAA